MFEWTNNTLHTNTEIVTVTDNYPQALKAVVDDLKGEDYSFPRQFVDSVILAAKNDKFVIPDAYGRPVVIYKIHEHEIEE